MSELSYGAVHVRTTDRVGLIEHLHAALGAAGFEFLPRASERTRLPQGARRLLLLPPKRGWTTVLPEDPALARELARDVAAGGPATLALVHVDDDLAFGYEAFAAGGEALDAYHSCPDAELAFDEDDASEAELERTRGNPARLAGLGVPGEPLAKLAEVLTAARIERLRDHDPSRARYADAEAPKRALLEALGLPRDEEGFDELWELGLFEEEDAELRALVYAPAQTEAPRRGLRGLLGLGEKRAQPAAPPPPRGRKRADEDEDDEDLGDDEDDEDLEDSRD